MPRHERKARFRTSFPEKSGCYPAVVCDIARMRVLLSVAGVLLGWQAIAGAMALSEGVRARGALPWRVRWPASPEERLRLVLGAEAELLAGLRQVSRPGDLILGQKVIGTPADLVVPGVLERLDARNRLLVQTTQLLFPHPFLLPVPDPIPAVEGQARRGRPARLCVLEGDPVPAQRPGWEREHVRAGFEIWSFRAQ